ncbi:MAG: hypothetical protein QOI98_15, partial [Solirubrobacteraceae bacterium]|nr:hypothetical protein [Solirubrobacteraceae bacterium]
VEPAPHGIGAPADRMRETRSLAQPCQPAQFPQPIGRSADAATPRPSDDQAVSVMS